MASWGSATPVSPPRAPHLADQVDSSVADRPSSPTSPQRTCVGCRTRAPQSQLLRVVAVRSERGTTAELDHNRPRQGRGAYLHPVMSCLDLAERRRALPRALRVDGAIDIEPLRHQMQELTEVGRDGEEHAMSAQK